MSQMEWSKLLSEARRRESEPSHRNDIDARNGFEDDYIRVVSCSAVRRLQDKAQVFPLEESDFVRTRLTHSIEVSAIARSMGVSVENWLVKHNKISETDKGKLSALLATAGLIHDLGNPPFGHYGETTIQDFFDAWFKDNVDLIERQGGLTAAQREDLLRFDGNAQTLRLVSRVQFLKDEFGLNLTLATMASVMKYPYSSLEAKAKNKKKFGYLQSEVDAHTNMLATTGISDKRHPACLLLEAADDLAYSIADIEDGVKKKVIDRAKIIQIFEEKLISDSGIALLGELKDCFNNIPIDYEDSTNLAIQRFRTKVQGYMIAAVVKCFTDNHDKILCGSFPNENILEESEAGEVRAAFKTLSFIIFSDNRVMERELAGDKVLQELLSIFTETVCKTPTERAKTKTKYGKLYKLISPNYRHILEKYTNKNIAVKDEDHQEIIIGGEIVKDHSLYDRLLLVTDFVCGMTDNYALELYRRLSGMKL